MKELIEKLSALAMSDGLRILGEVLILTAGWQVSGWAHNRVRRAAERSESRQSRVSPGLAKWTRPAVMLGFVGLWMMFHRSFSS